jgi:putative transposase
LANYTAARGAQQINSQIIQAIEPGISSRKSEEMRPVSPGVKRSSVARPWQETGKKFAEQLGSKNFGETTWYSLMLDAIRLSKDQTFVALGIGSKGNKHVLDFVLDSSESREIARELMGQIVKRGF